MSPLSVNIVQTSDVPVSNERLTNFPNEYVVIVPVEGEGEIEQKTRFGDRVSVRAHAYVYQKGTAYDLGIIPVFQGTIRALIRHAAANNAIVAGVMVKKDNRWTFTHDPADKAHAAALKAISARIDAGGPPDQVSPPQF